MLPLHPNLEHLKKQAKDLQKAHQHGEASICPTLRQLSRFAQASDDEILSTPISLYQAQHALAKTYGFTNWADLKAAVANVADAAEFVIQRTAVTELPAVAQVRHADAKTWLDPIPRYPREVEYTDQHGQIVRREWERVGRFLGNLFAAMRMQDAAITWEQVAASSGECFRFTFEANWAQDAEYVTPVDTFTSACEILGFRYTPMINTELSNTVLAINEALDHGQPAVVGMASRFWRVIVGIDHDTKVYLGIGGENFEHEGLESLRVPEGTEVPPTLAPEECLIMPVPEGDWYNAVMTPVQAAKNPSFFVGKRRPLPDQESIDRTLALALEMHKPRTIERINLDYRRQAIAMGPEGHDGWKYYYSPWPGSFTVGTEGYRAWAAAIAQLTKPSFNFEMIHGNDTTFGMQMRKMHDAAAWLGWAAHHLPQPARGHLLTARRLFKEAALVDLRMLCRWRDNIQPAVTDTRPDKLLRRIQDIPALVYLISDRDQQVLGELAHGHGSPWGFCLYPDQETYERAKAAGSMNLRKIADLRDQAFSEIEKVHGMSL